MENEKWPRMTVEYWTQNTMSSVTQWSSSLYLSRWFMNQTRPSIEPNSIMSCQLKSRFLSPSDEFSSCNLRTMASIGLQKPLYRQNQWPRHSVGCTNQNFDERKCRFMHSTMASTLANRFSPSSCKISTLSYLRSIRYLIWLCAQWRLLCGEAVHKPDLKRATTWSHAWS